MKQGLQVSHLRTFVKGVKDYYVLHNGADDKPFTIPKAMVRFALSHIQPDEQYLLLKELEEQRQIVAMDEATVTFSTCFVSSDN